MLVCILGLSACGKDYVSNIVSDKYKLTRIVQFTTRPIRSNELDGIDYHFVDKELFKRMIARGEFISFRIFNTTLGEWYYGITSDCLNDTEDSIICIDVEGLKELLENYNRDNILSIFIEADYGTRKERAEKRSNFDSDEFNRRYKDDVDKIDIIKEKCDYIIDNNSGGNCISDVCNILDLRLKCFWYTKINADRPLKTQA